jgi:hypothetical protein
MKNMTAAYTAVPKTISVLNSSMQRLLRRGRVQQVRRTPHVERAQTRPKYSNVSKTVPPILVKTTMRPSIPCSAPSEVGGR